MNKFDNAFLESFFDCRYDEPYNFDHSRSGARDAVDMEEYRQKTNLAGTLKAGKAVLGIDIYKYSQFQEETQPVVPFVFHLLAMRAFNVCLMTEPFLFQKYLKATFEESFNCFLETFVDTGDGGFFIFETPLHAFIFALLFESMIRNYNTRTIFHKAGAFTKEILVRYTLTFDTVYRYTNKTYPKFNNIYGTGLINCHRILSKDKLNRCLIDENTYKWFIANTNGVETLRSMPYMALKASEYFKDYEFSPDKQNMSFCMPSERAESNRGIDRLDILKIGKIRSKSDILSVYNLHAQLSYHLPFRPRENEDIHHFVVTLGNLNTAGISEEY